MAERGKNIWAERRDVPLTLLGWIIVLSIILWVLVHISRTLLVFLIAAVLAYTVAPAIRFFQRFMPKALAIVVVYLLVLSVLGIFFYVVVSTALHQTILLGHFIKKLITPGQHAEASPLVQFIRPLGISKEQIVEIGNQIATQAEHAFGNIFPFLKSFFNQIFDIIVIIIVSIYLLLDGEKIAQRVQHNAPKSLKSNVNIAIYTLERIVGAYIRGQLLLAVVIGFLVGIGMFLLHVPYAILLGVFALICAFIPILGTFISGAACVLLALTHGWVSALLVSGYFVGIHVVEGDILGPRVVGRALGLHPLVALLAVLTGTELFGITGAFLAAPITGLAQTILLATWREWKKEHPKEFVKGNVTKRYRKQ